MNILTTVTKVNFDINGLSVSYQKSSALRFEQHSLTLCPVATCKALKAARMIEGFEMDNNNEPVILFSTKDTAAGYNGQHWCDFVKSFRMTNRYAEMIIEAREEKKAFRKQYNIINKLMAPFAAA